MTNWGFDDSQTGDQGNNDINQPGGLRQFAEKQQQENKALKDQLEQIQNQLRSQQLQSVFNELGVPEALSHYTGDADPAKAKAWVEDQRRIFGGSTQGTPSPEANVSQQNQETLPPMLQQQFEQFTQAGQQGQPLGTLEQAHANVNDATDLKSLIAAMNFNR